MRRFAVRERDWNRVRDYLKKRATGTPKPEEKKSEAEQKEEEKMGEVPAPQQEKGAQAPALLVPAGMLPKIHSALLAAEALPRAQVRISGVGPRGQSLHNLLADERGTRIGAREVPAHG